MEVVMNNKIFMQMENDYARLSTIYEGANIKYAQLYDDNETQLYIEGLSRFNPFKKKLDKTPEVEVPDKEENSKISDAEITEKSGIIKRIVEWFKKVFRSIKDKIRKMMKSRSDKNQKVEVPKEVLDAIKEIKEYYQKTQAAMNQMGSGDVEKAADYIDNVPLPTGISNSTNVDTSRSPSSASSTTTNISFAERDRLIADLDKINSNMEKSIDRSEDNTLKTVDQKKKTGFKSIAIKILNKVNAVLGKLKKVVMKSAKVIAVLLAAAAVTGVGLYKTNKPFRDAVIDRLGKVRGNYSNDDADYDFDDDLNQFASDLGDYHYQYHSSGSTYI